MARPSKCRDVMLTPGVTYFKPQGIPMISLEEVTLTVDEFEALRLADLEANTQEQSAKKMKISRATFGRIIEKARCVVVDALVNGKAIRIEGGNYRAKKICTMHCEQCNAYVPSFKRSTLPISNCPKCKRQRT